MKEKSKNRQEFLVWLRSLNPSECSDVIGSASRHFNLEKNEARQFLEQYGSFSEDPNYEPGIA